MTKAKPEPRIPLTSVEQSSAALAMESLSTVITKLEHDGDIVIAQDDLRWLCAAKKAIERLRARLECDHMFQMIDGKMTRVDMEVEEEYDGIACRDETIRQQARVIAELRARPPTTPAPVDTAKGGEERLTDELLAKRMSQILSGTSVLFDVAELQTIIAELQSHRAIPSPRREAITDAELRIGPAVTNGIVEERRRVLDLARAGLVGASLIDAIEMGQTAEEFNEVPAPIGREEVIEECIQAVENVFFAMGRPDVHLMNFIREHLRALKAPSP